MKYFTMVHWKLHNVERSWDHRQTCSSFRCRNHWLKQTFYVVFHALKTLGGITTWSNAMTTFPLTLVDQILAQENLSDYQQLTWLNCKKKKKCSPGYCCFLSNKMCHICKKGEVLKWVILFIADKANFPFHNNPVEMLPIQPFLLMEIIVMKERSVMAI